MRIIGRLVGIGTCGPDVPGRRTYHLAWTAAVGEGGEPPSRVLASFELTLEDDWRIALWYRGSLAEWEAEHSDPFELASRHTRKMLRRWQWYASMSIIPSGLLVMGRPGMGRRKGK